MTKARSVFKLCDEIDEYITVVLYHEHVTPPEIQDRACLGLTSFRTFPNREYTFNCIKSTPESIVTQLVSFPVAQKLLGLRKTLVVRENIEFKTPKNMFHMI